MQGAGKDISPPAHTPLQPEDLPFWESVVDEFARADWTWHQLELASVLAQAMADLVRERNLLRKEGYTIVREILDDEGEVRKIVSCQNARARAVTDLGNFIMSMRRSLALHAKAKHGTNAGAGKKLAANKNTESAGKGGDDLLA